MITDHRFTDPAYAAAFDQHCYVRDIDAGKVETVADKAEAMQRRDELEASEARVCVTSAYGHTIYITPED